MWRIGGDGGDGVDIVADVATALMLTLLMVMVAMARMLCAIVFTVHGFPRFVITPRAPFELKWLPWAFYIAHRVRCRSWNYSGHPVTHRVTFLSGRSACGPGPRRWGVAR